MQQKVQFIGTLLHDPDLVILDEPFSGLDPINAQALKDAVVELKSRGKTVIFSTHLMDNAERLCDSVCIIARGEKVLDGGVAEVKAAHGGAHGRARRGRRRARRAIAPVLGDRTLVARVDDQNRFYELELAPGADAQQLLRRVDRRPARRSSASSWCSRRCIRSSSSASARAGVEEGMSGHGLSCWRRVQARVPRARPLASGSSSARCSGRCSSLLDRRRAAADRRSQATASRDVAHIDDHRRDRARAGRRASPTRCAQRYPALARAVRARRRRRAGRAGRRTARAARRSARRSVGYLVLDSHHASPGDSVRYAGRNASSHQRRRRHPQRRAQQVLAERMEREGIDAQRVAAFTRIPLEIAHAADRRQGAREGEPASARSSSATPWRCCCT